MKDEYLNILYKDFATKLHSVGVYNEKVQKETGQISQATYTLIGKLKAKYDILDKFQKTRQRAAPSSEFSLEVTHSGSPNADNSDIKSAEIEIDDIAHQVDYLFKKSEEELNFLLQSHNDLKNIINSIYDQFQNIFDKM